MLTQFDGTLACPIETGSSIVIAGKTVDGAKRLNINLRTDKKSTSNIGLQIIVSFGKNSIIRNSLIDGEWGDAEADEETEGSLIDMLSVIQPGSFFEICILASDTRFYVAINHKPIFTYRYRIPVHELKAIEVNGHVQVITQVDHWTIYPVAWPPVQMADSNCAFSADIPVLFAPGHVIVITATAYNNIKGRFSVKAFHDETRREGLHFNPRFSENRVIRNSMKTNLELSITNNPSNCWPFSDHIIFLFSLLRWNAEEVDGGMPFTFDQQFRLAIAFTDKEFLFAVDGIYFCSYAYRTNNILQHLNRLKMAVSHGLYIQVTSIDHHEMSSTDCDGFYIFSRWTDHGNLV